LTRKKSYLSGETEKQADLWTDPLFPMFHLGTKYACYNTHIEPERKKNEMQWKFDSVSVNGLFIVSLGLAKDAVSVSAHG
jgi:hypothetical protein